jgi:preprotein translocase subunit SecD
MRARQAAIAVIAAGSLAAACGATSSAGKAAPVHPTGPTTVLVLAGTRPLTSHALDATRTVITSRLKASGIDKESISIVGRDLRVTVPSGDVNAAVALALPVGQLRFRRALSIAKPAGSAAGTQTITTAGGPAPLPGSESPTLTPALEAAATNWNCGEHPNPTEGDDNPSDYIIACGTNPTAAYLLAPTAVEGTEITSAFAAIGSINNEWVVDLAFNGRGAKDWLALSKRAYEANNGKQNSPGSCTPPKGCNAIAIVLDGVIESAPNSEQDGIAGGRAELSGGFTQASAGRLADILKYGALPAPLKLQDTIRTPG